MTEYTEPTKCRVRACERGFNGTTMNGLCSFCMGIWVRSPMRARAIADPEADYEVAVQEFCEDQSLVMDGLASQLLFGADDD